MQQLLQHQDGSTSLFCEQRLENIVVQCFNHTHVARLIDYLYDTLKPIMREGEAIKHIDLKVRDIFQKYSKILWGHEVKVLISNAKMNPAELIRLHELSIAYKVDTFDPTYLPFKECYERYKEWIAHFTDHVYLKDLKSICEPTQISSNYKIVQHLVNTYDTLNVELEHAKRCVQYIFQCMEWYFTAKKCVERINSQQKAAYSSIKELDELAKELKLPEDFYFMKDVTSHYIHSSHLIEQTLQCFEAVKPSPSQNGSGGSTSDETALSRASFNPTTGCFRVDFWESLGPKYSFEKVTELFNNLKTSSIDFEKDAEDIQAYMTEFDKLRERGKQLLIHYKFDDHLLGTQEFSKQFYYNNWETLINDFDDLKKDIQSTFLSDKGLESQLWLFEWALAMLLLQNKKPLVDLVPSELHSQLSESKISFTEQFKDNNLEIWESVSTVLHQHKERFGSELFQKAEDSSQYSTINYQLSKAKQYSELVDRVRKQEETVRKAVSNIDLTDDSKFHRESLHTIDEIKQLLSDLELLAINLKKDTTYLFDISKRYTYFSKQLSSMIGQASSRRAPKPNKQYVEDLLRQFLQLPLKYQKEHLILSKSLLAHHVLDENLKKVQQYMSSFPKHQNKLLDYRLAEIIATRSRECTVAHPEAEKIEKEFLLNNQEITAVERAFTSREVVVREDLMNYYHTLKGLKVNFGLKQINLTEQCWLRLVEILKIQLQRGTEQAVSKNSKRLQFTYETLCNLLQDGYNFIDARGNKAQNYRTVKESTKFLEQTIDRVEQRIEEIYGVQDLKQLGKALQYVDECVDLTPEISKMKAFIMDQLSDIEPVRKEAGAKERGTMLNGDQHQKKLNRPRVKTIIRDPIKKLQANEQIRGGVILKSGHPSIGRPFKVIHDRRQNLNYMGNESDRGSVDGGSKKSRVRRKGSENSANDDDTTEGLSEKDLGKRIKVDKNKKIDVTAPLEHTTAEKKLRGNLARDLKPILETNSHFPLHNKGVVYSGLIQRLTDHLFKLHGNSQSKYSQKAKRIVNTFSKLKASQFVSRSLAKTGFDLALVMFLSDYSDNISDYEKALRLYSKKSLMSLMEEEYSKNDASASQSTEQGQIKIEEQQNLDAMVRELQNTNFPKIGIRHQHEVEDDLITRADNFLDLKPSTSDGKKLDASGSVDSQRSPHAYFIDTGAFLGDIYKVNCLLL